MAAMQTRRLAALTIMLAAGCSGGGKGGDGATPTPTPTGSATPTPTATPVFACPANPAALFPAWQNGGNCAADVEVEVHSYDADTFILRQSLCTNFEGPFLYLLFGSDKVLLQDTGATGTTQVRPVVQQVIADWLAANGKTSIELAVTNSHAHGDHTAGNASFTGQPGTTVVGTTTQAVYGFFGITGVDDTAEYDLGGRIVDVIPIPGHQAAHIALYDRSRGLLLTGDTLYPGRLYIQSGQIATYRQSIARLANFVAGKDVCSVLGTHIEMTTTAGVDYAFGDATHDTPPEHVLRLTLDDLLELRDATAAMSDTATQEEVHDHFIITPL